MARERKKTEVNKDAWLNTYADMITLILVFFILLFAMSTIDQEKYRLLVKAFTADPSTLEQLSLLEGDEGEIEEPISVDPGDVSLEEIQELDDLFAYLRQYVRDNGLEDSVQVEKTDDVVYVRFMSTLFFEPDRSVLKQQGAEILDAVGAAISRVESVARFIRIDGHTAEAGGDEHTVNNRDLSTERANVVLKYLEFRYVKDPSKLYAVGYGFYRPVAANDSEVNRAKNRRVEILVGKKDALQDELEHVFGNGE